MKHTQIFPTNLFQWRDVLSPQDFESAKNAVQFDKANVDIPVLKRFILDTAMPEVARLLGADPSYIIELTEMWGNVLQTGEDHEYHSHPNSIFSGIFYLTEGNPTMFCDPRPATNILRLNTTLNPFSCSTMGTQAVPNELVIFDSWLWHYVRVNKTPDIRKTISFNIIFRGEYGNKNSRANVRI